MIKLDKINSRFQASLIHLFFSLVIICAVIISIIYLWYPHNLFYAGAIDGMKIAIGVDLILGPLLTFIVFNKAKKELVRDLVIICLIQLSVLFSGLYLVYNERPVLQILADDGIHIVSHSDLKTFKLTESQMSKKYKPAAFLLDLPDAWVQIASLKLVNEMVQERLFVYRDDLHIPFEDITNEVFISHLEKIKEHKSELLISDQEKPEFNPTKNCHWLRLFSKHHTGYACINYEQGIVDISNKKIF